MTVSTKQKQKDKFIDKARELDCDEDEAAFDKRLTKVTPPEDKRPKTKSRDNWELAMPDYVSIKYLLDASGSDKGKWYGGLYDVLLQPHRLTIRSVVEIGIGTMIPLAPSSMVGWAGENYHPGASLRVWRDFFPNAIIHGLDVAPDTQFSEDRIQTHLCNSTKPESVQQILPLIGTPDLIIDDGLHTLEAKANLDESLSRLGPGGAVRG